MGTNFYWIMPGHIENYNGDDPAFHIGKRSAAGAYCWTCDVTLCREGNAAIHRGPKVVRHDSQGFIDWKHYHAESEKMWYNACPQCGAELMQESVGDSAGGIELGFAETKRQRPTGVRSVASFSWAQEPERVGVVCRDNTATHIIQDEYGKQYTGQEFLDMLEHNCPIQFTHSIGVEFS